MLPCYNVGMRFSIRFILLSVMPCVAFLACVWAYEGEELSYDGRAALTILFLLITALTYPTAEYRGD